MEERGENFTNTEELLAEFDRLNEEGIEEECFVGSADLVVLYPCLDIDKVIKTVGEMTKKSEIILEGVNFEELGLYLAIAKD